MNVLYNDGDDSVYCFPENINVYVVADIDFTKTQVRSRNKDLIYVGDILDMWLYTFDKLGECYDEQDYSKSFKIEVVGPNDTRKFTKNYEVRRTNNKDLECNNEYQIITKDPEDIYTISGGYVIHIYADDKILYTFPQECRPLGYSKFYLELYFDKEAEQNLANLALSVADKKLSTLILHEFRKMSGKFVSIGLVKIYFPVEEIYTAELNV